MLYIPSEIRSQLDPAVDDVLTVLRGVVLDTGDVDAIDVYLAYIISSLLNRAIDDKPAEILAVLGVLETVKLQLTHEKFNAILAQMKYNNG